MLNLNIVKHNNTDVMSSVDLAELCGQRHFDFNKKAKLVLGEDVLNFSYMSKDAYGRDLPILMLPEREACLMAMSYSYELQAKVYDSWKALTVSHKPEAVLRAEEYQAIHILLNEYDPEWVRQERERLLPTVTPPAPPAPLPVPAPKPKPLPCPVRSFIENHTTSGFGLSVTSRALYEAFVFFKGSVITQAMLTRTIKSMRLNGVYAGQVRCPVSNTTQRGFKGLSL